MNLFKRLAAILLPLVILLCGVSAVQMNAFADTQYVEASLTVGDSIVTNYYIDYEHYKALGADTLYYSYNSSCEEEEYTLSETTVDLNNIGEDVTLKDGKIAFSVSQAAAQLAEPATIRLYNSSTGETVYELTYSAKDYCNSVIAMSNSDLSGYTQGRGASRLKAVCKSIIAYSKAAQSIFTEYMAKDSAVAVNDDYSSDLGINSASYASDYVKENDNIPGENVSFRTASFICTSEAKMRFYFNVNDESDATYYGDPVVSGADVSCEKGYTLEDEGKSYFIQVNDIKPVDFDKKITVSYAGASIRMSVLDYASRIIALSSDNSLKALARTLIIYNEKANEYFNAEIHNMTLVPASDATCTETGNTAYYYCSDCGKYFADSEGETETTLESITTAALGHDLTTTPEVPATCTTSGTTALTTCSRCDYTSGGETIAALGHDWVKGTTVAPTHSADGYTNYSCSRCDATKTDDVIPALNIKVKLPNVNSYLYRVGTTNTIALGALFEIEDSAKNSIDSSKVTVTVTKHAGNSAGTFTANTSDWTAATLKFSGLGVAKVTVKQAGTTAAELLLETVAGNNKASGSLGAVTSNNVVLFGDVTTTSSTISNGYTIYGNGYSITDTRTNTGTASGFINISSTGGGSIDNARIIGLEYDNQVTSGVTNQGYAPGIRTEGSFSITNCYVSGCKNAIEVHGGNNYIYNTTIDGGSISNIEIVSGTVTMENCITTKSTRGTKSGLSIWIASSTASKLIIKGSLEQYNLVKKDDIPSPYNGFVSDVYNDSTYYYTISGTKYVNMGVMCVDTSNSIQEPLARTIITDNRSASDIAKYSYCEQSAAGIYGTLYTTKSANNATLVTPPEYVTTGQYYTAAKDVFDYTTKNYQENDGGSTYCYYSSTTNTVNISFEENSSKEWDPMILTSTKQNQTLSYTVSMNGTDYTNKKITFTQAGDYEVKYIVTDPYNYDKDGNASSRTYEKTVSINIVIVEAGAVTYSVQFSYVSSWANSAKIVTINNENYVMPDVSATSDLIASTTVSGTTVYCPVVTVNPTTSTGGSYSSGDGYFLTPAFNAINITDFDQTTGSSTNLVYNSSTQKWPRSNSATTGPDSSVFGCPGVDGGATYNSGNSPWRSDQSNSGVYTFKYANAAGGLVFSTNAISNNKAARERILQFHYTSMEGKTYYYYIKYVFPAFTYVKGSVCLAEGSQVTMADGTTKAIEDVKAGDEVLTYNHFEGKYEPQNVLINLHHADGENRVLNLNFDDGTTVRMLYEHGFYDLDKNTYVYITEDNVGDYIGDSFTKYDSAGNTARAVLTGYELTVEEVNAYEMATAYNVNFIVDGMLSTPAEDMCPGLYEFFGFGDNMTYDSEQMQADIETYGLYTYEDFAECMTEEQFNLFNFKYLKANVVKGKVSFEKVVEYINEYITPNM